jgi:DNA-binding MarR family transcriptional regulator
MLATTVLLEKLASLIQQSLRADAARHGLLLPIHVQILQCLASGNRQRTQPMAIADYCGVMSSSISQTPAILERRGLVQRERDVGHRRPVRVRLAMAGSATVAGSGIERLDNYLQESAADTARLEDSLRPHRRATGSLGSRAGVP